MRKEGKCMVVEGRFDTGFKFYGPFDTLEEAEKFGWAYCGKYEWWYEQLTDPEAAVEARAASKEA